MIAFHVHPPKSRMEQAFLFVVDVFLLKSWKAGLQPSGLERVSRASCIVSTSTSNCLGKNRHSLFLKCHSGAGKGGFHPYT